MGAVDIILLVLIGGSLILAVVSIVRRRKKGEGCFGSCQSCGRSGSCSERERP